MLSTIVFFIALLSTGFYANKIVTIAFSKTIRRSQEDGALIFQLVAVILWSWLYYLSH